MGRAKRPGMAGPHAWLGGEAGGPSGWLCSRGLQPLPELLSSCFTPFCPARAPCPAALGTERGLPLALASAESHFCRRGPQLRVGTIPRVPTGAELGSPGGAQGAAGRRGSPGDGRVHAGAVVRGAIRQRAPARCRSGAGEWPWTASHPARAPAGPGSSARPGRVGVPSLLKKPEVLLREQFIHSSSPFHLKAAPCWVSALLCFLLSNTFYFCGV